MVLVRKTTPKGKRSKVRVRNQSSCNSAGDESSSASRIAPAPSAKSR
jgi:hypothetical protein